MKKLLFLTALFALTSNSYAKDLILYFTQPESIPMEKLDGVSGASKIVKEGEAFGATEYLARQIQQQNGGDLVRLETVQAYPTVHQPLLDVAQEEIRKNARPQLKGVPNLAEYDRIFVGYPIWWYQMPMALYSLFEQNDFAGKTIVPFVAHGGSRFSGSLEQIEKMQPKAAVRQGFEAYLFRTTKADPSVEKALHKWLDGLK